MKKTLICLCFTALLMPETTFAQHLPDKSVKPGFVLKEIKEKDLSEKTLPHPLLAAYSWEDDFGKNELVFCHSGLMKPPMITGNDLEDGMQKAQIYVLHFMGSKDGKNYKLNRKIYDFQNDCPFNLLLQFIEGSLTLTDLDEDGFGEISFLYKKACRNAAEPAEMKLVLLENGEKYAMRGLMGLPTDTHKKDLGNPLNPEKVLADESLKKTQAFFEFAKTRWIKFVCTDGQ